MAADATGIDRAGVPGWAPVPDDEIRLTIPARHEYARIARVGVAALALRLGFDYSEVEELRLAVDEALILLLRTDRPGDRVTVRYQAGPGELAFRAVAQCEEPPGPPAEEALGRFATLVGDLVDEWSVADDGTWVELAKHHAD